MMARIRFAEPQDAEGVLAIYAPFCESTIASFENAPTTEQMADRIARISRQYPWLICDVDGRVAGYVYACQHRERSAYGWSVETTAYMAEGYRRRGLGRALYTALFSILREQGYYEAFAGISLPNEASVRLHEAMGFMPIGVYRGVGYKLGRWVDVGWWQADIQPQRIDPAPPRPIGELRTSATVAAALAQAERLLRLR